MSAAGILQYLITSLRSKDGEQKEAAAALLQQAASHLQIFSPSNQDDISDLQVELFSILKRAQSNDDPSAKQLLFKILAIVAGECSGEHFLANYQQWGEDAVSNIRQAATPESWYLVDAVLVRLRNYIDLPGVRRDASSVVSKLVTFVIRSHPETAILYSLEALNTVHNALITLPASFRQHVQVFEPWFVHAMLLNRRQAVRNLGAKCVAALPRASADGSAWVATVQRLLATADVLLNAAFIGLEDAHVVASQRQSISSSVKPYATEWSSADSRHSSTLQLLAQSMASDFLRLHALIGCLKYMLKSSYATPVAVPLDSLLSLAARIVSFDESILSNRPVLSAGSRQLAELWTNLPQLHCEALRLLSITLGSCGSRCNPLLGALSRVLSSQLGIVAVAGGSRDKNINGTSLDWEKRAELYKACQGVLENGGLGASKLLAPSLLPALETELYSQHRQPAKRDDPSAAEPASKKAKKAKHQNSNTIVDSSAVLLSTFGTSNDKHQITSQIAALRCLKAVFASGGAGILSPEVRTKVDNIASHMAMSTFELSEKLTHSSSGDASQVKELQLAAYDALLASLLAPTLHRPAHLDTSVRLYSASKHDSCPGVAKASIHALLCIEAYLHPRPSKLLSTLSKDLQGSGKQQSFRSMGVLDTFDENKAIRMPQFWSVLDMDASLQDEAIEIIASAHLQQENNNSPRKVDDSARNKSDVVQEPNKAKTSDAKRRSSAVDAGAKPEVDYMANVSSLGLKRKSADIVVNTDDDMKRQVVDKEAEPEARNDVAAMETVPLGKPKHVAVDPATKVPQAAAYASGHAGEEGLIRNNLQQPVNDAMDTDADSMGSLPEIDSGASSSEEE